MTAPAPLRQPRSDAAVAPGAGEGGGSHHLERRIARLLTVAGLAGVVLIALGVVAMAATGTTALGGGGTFDAARLPADVLALRPAGLLWLGLLVIVATPSARVAAALLGFALERDRRMVAIAAAILAVIVLSVLAGREG